MSVLNCTARPSLLADITVLLSVTVLMAFDYPNGTYTIAALPIIGILLVIGWFGVRKRVAEIHSTAPVVEEDEENRKLCLSLKHRVNCKIARLRAGQIQTTDEGAGCGVIKVRQFFPFSPSPYLLQRNTNHIVRLGSFLLFSGFCFTLTYSVLPSADSAGCSDESAYRTFSPLYSFSRQSH